MQNRGGPAPEDTRNLMIAFALIIVILFGFEMFVTGPQRREQLAEQARIEADRGGTQSETPNATAPAQPRTREEALSATASARAVIDTGSVDGSIALTGARFDDLNLRGYRRQVEPDSPEVALLEPIDTPFGSDAFFGWEEQDQRFPGVGASDVWSVADGARLTAETPLVLRFDSGDGIVVTRTISVDENYMFTIVDAVENVSGAARTIRPFGAVRRHNKPQDYQQMGVVHQGMVGVFGPKAELRETRFENADKFARRRARGEVGADQLIEQAQGRGGWLGITDHYWMTAIAVDANEEISAAYNATTENGYTDYRAYYTGAWRNIPAGQSVSYTQRLFAGAKRVDMLRGYQEEFNIPRFDDAVDWGKLAILTRPFFAMLDYFGKMFGHFGWAIVISTVVIKIALFPLVYQSFKSMAKMRQLQPKMKEIQERYAADKQRMQQEQMQLFKTEKVNPLSGCMPLLLQLPVFFALFKVLMVTIEMRHTPFIGWIDDLSARDPTSVFNVFGLLPYDPTAIPLIGAFLGIGVWPILNGVTMWALQGLSPPPTDPMQAKIFQFLPVVYTLFFAGLASGLVIYYTWSNVLTIAQQYVIMRRQGVETQFDMFIAKRLKRQKPAQAE